MSNLLSCRLIHRVNARLGGTNSYADSPFFREVVNKLGVYMVIGLFASSYLLIHELTCYSKGADAGHPGPGIQLPSVTSIVYSWDRYATKYAALTGIQQPRQEIIENFNRYVKTAITNFRSSNGMPSCIFFFRDGVSEGEYMTVAREERDQLQGMFCGFFLFFCFGGLTWMIGAM